MTDNEGNLIMILTVAINFFANYSMGKLFTILLLSLILQKLTNWRFIPSLLVAISTEIFSSLVMVFVIPLWHLQLVGNTIHIWIAYQTLKIFLVPFLRIAFLRTVSTLYIHTKNEFNFGILAYLILLFFEIGRKILDILISYLQFNR